MLHALRMGAPSKRARKIRSATEFDMARLAKALSMPVDARSNVFAWSLPDIYAARDAQMRGQFRLAAKAAESMRTDDALHVAYLNRLAPQRCLSVRLDPAKASRGPAIANEAEGLFGDDGVGLTASTLNSVEGCLVNHGVAFGVNTATPRPDGSRIDLEMHYWPIEYVRWDPVRRLFMTLVDPSTVTPADLAAASGSPMSGYEVPIVHGDGRWVIFSQHEIDAWKQEAAILSALLVWARHAFTNRDWAKGSVAFAAAKMISELPPGVPLQKAGGEISDEAAAMVALMRALLTSDLPIGIRPSGSKTEFVTNNSSNYQVWEKLIENAERAAARIYLGTDGMLGAQGGAPGVDISALFGVATTKVEGDLECIERAVLTGVIEPWCAMNFGDSSLAPKRKYIVPDADGDRARDSYAKRKQAFYADIAAARENGFAITQPYVDGLAKKYDVESITLAAPKEPATQTPAASSPPATAPAEPPTPATATATRLRLVEPPGAPTELERAEHAMRMNAALLADIREARALGLEYSQDQIESTAKRYGVPAPKIATK